MKNILLITIDSLRADHLNCYGYKNRVTSPNIDRIAKQGYFFENAMSHSMNTSNSLPSILTSTYPLMFGKGLKNKTTISQVLKALGYKTIGLHSNAVVTHTREYGKGFDCFRDLKNDSDTGGLFGNKSWILNYIAFGRNRPYTPADELVDTAIRYIEENKDKNLFLWLFFMDVHHPYLPPSDFYGPKTPVGRMKALRIFQKARTYFAGKDRSKELSKKEKEEIIKYYDGSIRFTDQQIGKLFDSLDKNNWVIVITADHGDELFDRGWFGHGTSFHEEIIHVPLIIYDGQGSKKIKNVVGHIDIAPTILELIERKPPDCFYGVSAIKNKRKAVVGNTQYRVFYRDDKWKIIKNNKNDMIELYDLHKDPGELNNLIKQETEKTIELLSKLGKHDKWLKREEINYKAGKLKLKSKL